MAAEEQHAAILKISRSGISPESFYQKTPESDNLKQRSRRASIKRCLVDSRHSQKTTSVPSTNLLPLSAPIKIWKKFSTQKKALEFLKEYDRKLYVFSREKDEQGRREFIVADINYFWRQYELLASKNRNYYELIVQGSPCKLYFDLEFDRASNPNVNGETLTEILVKLIISEINLLFAIEIDSSRVLHLDSTSCTKFSRHLVLFDSRCVFRDNQACGDFVRRMCQKIACASTDRDDPLSQLIVKNSNNENVLFCDLSVYSKNRNFRLYLSSKVAKLVPLVLVHEESLDLRGQSLAEIRTFSQCSKQILIFLTSLVTCVTPTESFLEVQPSCLPNESCYLGTSASQLQNPDHEGYYQSSPYPEVDHAVREYVQRGGVKGVIRRWRLFLDSLTLIYDIENNRWCDRIGRAHKSNHIYIVADIRLGLLYQKCHDPECIGFRSRRVPLSHPDVHTGLDSTDTSILEYETTCADESLIEQLNGSEKNLTSPPTMLGNERTRAAFLVDRERTLSSTWTGGEWTPVSSSVGQDESSLCSSWTVERTPPYVTVVPNTSDVLVYDDIADETLCMLDIP